MESEPRVIVRDFDISPEFDQALREHRMCAWDIETSGLDFRIDHISTCQIYIPGVGVEVVRLYGDIPERLRDVLMSDRVSKVFHHAPFDLRFMSHHWKASARNVACTKVISRILEPNAPDHSLQTLVGQYLGVSLDKGERLSNWDATDLSEEQIQYAARDVLYLPDLLRALWRNALNEGIADLAEASFDYLPVRAATDLRASGDVFAY